MQTSTKKPDTIKLMRPKQFAKMIGVNDYTMSRLMKQFKGTDIIKGATGRGRRPLINADLALWYIKAKRYLY